jgi:C4-dicarboxylate transporter DctM subunit
MSPVTVGIIGFVVLFALITLKVPIGISMMVVGSAGIWYLLSDSAAIAKMAIVPFFVSSRYDLSVLPAFLLMAHIIFVSGLSKDLYDLAARWLGHLPGGLAAASVGACAGFAAVSASSTAASSTVGLVAIPEMKRYKYDPALATGSVAAGGTMGGLIPPSGILIIYGIITETSIGRLFAAGIVPGILEAVIYIFTIYILCKWKPSLGPRGPSYSLKEKVVAFRSCGEIVGLIGLVLGGLFAGWFTPTEAGAVAAFGAILFSLIRRRLNWQRFKEALVGTMKTTGMIYCILIGAFIFQYFVAVTTIPFMIADFIGGLAVPSLVVIIAIMIVYLFLGCVMDVLTMVLLTIPVFLPLVLSLGFDPIWFAILVVRMTEIGAITPPIGINVYVISGVAPDIPMSTIFKGILPFFAADILLVTLLLLVPSVVLFLPNLIY